MITGGKVAFSIDLGVLAAVNQLIPPKSTILELGSGEGQTYLQQYNVYSVEDNMTGLAIAKSTYIHCPLMKLIIRAQQQVV